MSLFAVEVGHGSSTADFTRSQFDTKPMNLRAARQARLDIWTILYLNKVGEMKKALIPFGIDLLGSNVMVNKFSLFSLETTGMQIPSLRSGDLLKILNLFFWGKQTHQHICSKEQSRRFVSLMNNFKTSGQSNVSAIKKNPALPEGSIENKRALT